MKLKDLFEDFYFKNELPGPRNAHQFPRPPKQKGPSEFPYDASDEEMLSDEDIDKELKLELKLGNVMRDPLNLPNHNAHNGSDSWGKGSKPFGNFQTKTSRPTQSQEDTMVQPIEETIDPQHDPETNEMFRKALGRKLVHQKEAASQRKTRDIPSNAWECFKTPKPLEEDIGVREKARAYGTQITTKQPFSSGLPKKTGSEFMDEDEIMKELGLMEWIGSSPVLNRRAAGTNSEFEFFEKDRPPFTMNTEEEFNENQRKLGSNEKKKKRK